MVNVAQIAWKETEGKDEFIIYQDYASPETYIYRIKGEDATNLRKKIEREVKSIRKKQLKNKNKLEN